MPDDAAARSHPDPSDSVLDLVGGTPMVRLRSVVDGAVTPVYGKAEYLNPGGSLKDRIGLAIVEDAEREGELQPGGTIVEGTSGNTGVGLAMAAAVKGYRCVFAIPDKMSAEKVRLLKGFGAEVIVTPAAVDPDHPDYYGNVARRIARERPGAVLADQFYNPVNPEAHYRTTGPEIWEQTDGRITHFVASAGTGGCISGAARYLKERNPEIRVVAGDPVGSIYRHYAATGEKTSGSPYKVEGVGNDKIPDTLHFDVIDEFREVGDREAFLMARRITREEGLFVGGSTGLNVLVAARVAREVDDPGACIVTILCDTGERYLSKLYDDAWMRENRMLEPDRVTARYLLETKGADTPAGLVAVDTDTPVRKALELLEAHGVSQLPVMGSDGCVGSVTEGGLMAAVLREPGRLDDPVEALADEPFPEVEEDAELEDLNRTLRRDVPAVLVTGQAGYRGILTRYDLLHHLMGDRGGPS